MPKATVPKPVKENAAQVKEGKADKTTPSSETEELTEIKKFETESYEGIIPALIRVRMEVRYDDPEEGELLLFRRDCLMKSKTFARMSEKREKMRRKEMQKKKKGKGKGKGKKAVVEEDDDDDIKSTASNESETLPIAIYYIGDAGAASGDVKKECTPLEDLLKDADECFHACKLSRSKPDGVDAGELAFVTLNDMDPYRGSLFFTGPPGSFWLWDIEEMDDKSYEGIIPALIRVPMELRIDKYEPEFGDLLLFGSDFIMKSKTFERMAEKTRREEMAITGKVKEDVVVVPEAGDNDDIWSTMSGESETLPMVLYYIGDAGAESRDVEKECMPIEDILKDTKVCFHACKLSRSRPDGVDTSKLAFMGLNHMDPYRGSLFFTGPPGSFWLWDIEAYLTDESDFIDEVHVEIMVCRFGLAA
ncbi:hypothetical protein FRB99_007812 [Tulasnella sp. 403]|nr:hypothetical protein FRB99_007812 [Tulasnella sp. 403]